MQSFFHWTTFAALVTSATTQAQTRQFAWPSDLAGKSILYVGAHPDDEWGVSPLLAEACIDGGAKCHFVVASEAHSYGCLLTIKLADPEKCSKIRRKEMLRSAKLFGAKAEFFGWADLFYAFDNSGLDQTSREWVNQSRRAPGASRPVRDDASGTASANYIHVGPSAWVDLPLLA